jgi:hypothetical protein
METIYTIKKLRGLYRVVLVSCDKVQFTSACRANCVDWLADNTPKEITE